MGEIMRHAPLTEQKPARVALLACAVALIGCGNVQPVQSDPPPPPNPVTSVIPSATGTPNSVTTFGNFAFVSVQGVGMIATYALGSSSQTPVATFATPCMDPSGMVATAIGGVNVLAAVCFDNGALITLTINSDGSLHALGSVGGLSEPFPGIALDGITLYVPLFGGGTANGVVAKISLANPAAPAVTGSVTLVSPAPGEHVNAVSLATSGGYVYVAAGSESQPQSSSSSIQVIDESTMTLTGAPFIVPHSPQQIVIAGSLAWVTLYDVAQFEAVDISNPTALKSIAIAPLTACHPIPVAIANNTAYIGCYAETSIARLNITNPLQITLLTAISNITSPEDMAVSGNLLLVTDASPGGALYTINLNEL